VALQRKGVKAGGFTKTIELVRKWGQIAKELLGLRVHAAFKRSI